MSDHDLKTTETVETPYPNEPMAMKREAPLLLVSSNPGFNHSKNSAPPKLFLGVPSKKAASKEQIEDELFSCVTFSDPRAVFGATTGSILLGRVPSTRRRVHWVGPWPPSTSNNHRCTDAADNHRSVGSDVRATHVRLRRVRLLHAAAPRSPKIESSQIRQMIREENTLLFGRHLLDSAVGRWFPATWRPSLTRSVGRSTLYA
ncbi:hypothetical protein THAOC_02994 [Thalassiosira oceanica]|uniref:Uncharacterized protein n=1 Tax=Thalassiosira oceanica TaxID=159749 RepID=K0TLG8_THAOC|nr:hypothetical protein THAOC_02994 [Thalassiosira oceanica]|eukprot:EJK75286.1 hypothetical protein THAOC_02994 [Thalassiosira oceanica]